MATSIHSRSIRLSGHTSYLEKLQQVKARNGEAFEPESDTADLDSIQASSSPPSLKLCLTSPSDLHGYQQALVIPTTAVDRQR